MASPMQWIYSGHRCNGYGITDANLENGERLGGLEYCSPRDHKNSNTAGRLNNIMRSNNHAPEQQGLGISRNVKGSSEA